MPNSRHRELDQTYGLTGSYQTFPPFPSLVIQTAVAGIKVVCDDQVCAPREKRMPQTLLIVRKEDRFPTFSGRFPLTGNPIKQLTNCPTDYKPSPPSPGTKFPALSTIQQSSLAWESLAATNPNVAHVSLPTFWAELKDLPMLWRTWGTKQVQKADNLWKEVTRSANRHDRRFVELGARYMRKHSASLGSLSGVLAKTSVERDNLMEALAFAPKAYIWYRWGWAPLVSDIQRMFQLTESVFRRVTWLSHLMSGDRTIKRRATLRNATDYDPPTTVQLKSVGANIQGRRTVTYSERVWCTVQWKLDSAYKLSGVGLEGDPLWRKAVQLTFGITTQDALSALWEIIPWSWFVDWFLHVQTVMDATKNTIPLTWGPICLMRHTRATALVSPLATSADLTWCKPSGEHQQSEDRKQRLIVTPVLPFAPSMMPVFTTGQWSILGSLAALKLTRR